MGLSGKVFAVTGGFGILGLAVGRAATALGARVALIDRSTAPKAGQLPPPLSDALLLGGVELSELEAARQALERVAQHHGGVDVLVNVAGAFRWQTLEAGDVANWDLLYRMNVMTAVMSSRSALPHLRRRGRGAIINIGAAAAAKAAAGMGAYASSKAGVAKLTESLSDELKDAGITVNAVLPSIIDTPANRADMPTADFSRWVTPEAVADVILFLASDSARSVTGALVPVYGRV